MHIKRTGQQHEICSRDLAVTLWSVSPLETETLYASNCLLFPLPWFLAAWFSFHVCEFVKYASRVTIPIFVKVEKQDREETDYEFNSQNSFIQSKTWERETQYSEHISYRLGASVSWAKAELWRQQCSCKMESLLLMNQQFPTQQCLCYLFAHK